MTNFNCSCDEGMYNAETLYELRLSLLERLGYAASAANPPPGMVALLNNFLRRSQNFLYRRYRALHTERFFNWDMVEGERFYDLRDNSDECTRKWDPLKLSGVWLEDPNGAWMPLSQGIHPGCYTSVAQNGMPSMYDIRQCIEVFPAPDQAYTLHVKGDFGLDRFTEDTDHATIDSELLFLWALANAKNHYGQADAQDVAAQGQTYLRELVAASHGTRRYVPGMAPPIAVAQPRMDWDPDA